MAVKVLMVRPTWIEAVWLTSAPTMMYEGFGNAGEIWVRQDNLGLTDGDSGEGVPVYMSKGNGVGLPIPEMYKVAPDDEVSDSGLHREIRVTLEKGEDGLRFVMDLYIGGFSHGTFKVYEWDYTEVSAEMLKGLG